MCLCGEDECLETLEKVPSIPNNKLLSDQCSSSVLVTQSEHMDTEI